MLAAEAEVDAVAPHGDMALAQSRDAVRARGAGVLLRTDPKPAAVDQSQSDRRHALVIELLTIEGDAHHRPQLGQLLREADQPVVFLTLLPRAEVPMVEILLSSGLVEAGRLEFGVWTRRDPNVLPGRRGRQPFDALERVGVLNRATVLVEIDERLLSADAGPASSELRP